MAAEGDMMEGKEADAAPPDMKPFAKAGPRPKFAPQPGGGGPGFPGNKGMVAQPMAPGQTLQMFFFCSTAQINLTMVPPEA